MSDQELELLLLDRLQCQEDLTAKEYGVQLDELGSVVIHRAGHVRGIWRAVLGVLEWTPAGYNSPLFRVADVEAAVWHTLIALGLNGRNE